MALIPVITLLYDTAKLSARNPDLHGGNCDSGSYRRNEYINTEEPLIRLLLTLGVVYRKLILLYQKYLLYSFQNKMAGL